MGMMKYVESLLGKNEQDSLAGAAALDCLIGELCDQPLYLHRYLGDLWRRRYAGRRCDWRFPAQQSRHCVDGVVVPDRLVWLGVPAVVGGRVS